MCPCSQLLHVEELQKEGHCYRLAVFCVDGGIIGKWSCEACQSEHGHHDCPAFSTVDGCLNSLKRAIKDHHRTEHPSASFSDAARAAPAWS